MELDTQKACLKAHMKRTFLGQYTLVPYRCKYTYVERVQGLGV